jgi:hypothetical protein
MHTALSTVIIAQPLQPKNIPIYSIDAARAGFKYLPTFIYCISPTRQLHLSFLYISVN